MPRKTSAATKPATCQLVAYYRVSTREQGDSGLGLEAQRESVKRYQQTSGCEIIKEFEEVETSTKATLSNRPKLAEAIKVCRRTKAVLVIAKLDRLARNVHFLSGLMESGIEFVACDNPSANRLLVHVLAAVAESEAEAISTRTKAALAAYKARGGLLGGQLPQCRNLTEEGRRKGSERAGAVRAAQAKEAYQDVEPIILEMRAGGATYSTIVAALNEQGHTLISGKPWNEVQVMRILRRSQATR